MRADFHKTIWDHYHASGRHDLPWRVDIRPYAILVSEIMLQQTQVSRVIPKFEDWMERWPDVPALAGASRRDILSAWQGLGYNNRALRLHQLAKVVVREYAGQLPKQRDQLEALPGIGPYTSGAIMAFAYNEPVVFADTNIRRIMLHHFFLGQQDVSDREVLEQVAKVLPKENARAWYWALMDYGSYLGNTLRSNNPNRRSRHYNRQSTFAGSDRQIRGAIVRVLVADGLVSGDILRKRVEADLGRIIETNQYKRVLASMVQEGLVQKRAGSYSI